MLGSTPGSPFRSGSTHRAPWPPPSHHASEGFSRYGVSGGLYSLFPGTTETSATIYSQATNATGRYAHSTNTYHSFIGSHKVADSLFTSGYTFGGPTPPPQASGPPFSPVGPLVERGITQLELMAKGFNNNNITHINNNISIANANECVNSGNILSKKAENKRRLECNIYQDSNSERRQSNGSCGTVKRRWERELSQAPVTPPVVKTELTSRPSCGCRRTNVSTSNSPSPLPARNTHNNGPDINNGPTTFPQSDQCVGGERKKHDASRLTPGGGGGGCSRTNPVALRNGGAADFQNVVIKKEPGSGGSVTPCQVAEVTTSLKQLGAGPPAASPAPSTPLSPLAAVIKVETASSCAGPPPKKETSLQTQHLASINNAGNIPVGIAVARQRGQDNVKSSGGGLLLTTADSQQSPLCSRQQKTLVPPPATELPQQCGTLAATTADITPAAGLSAMAVLQPPCDDRAANGIAPWAATTNHNPALTPPTLWQYPASVPVQLSSTEHLPLPPVGYQLVRDPMSGHFLLIPTTNLTEHLQRTILWPSYPTTIQPSLHMTTQPTTQHIQLYESAEPTDFAQTTRILVQPQLTITATNTTNEAAPIKRKPTVTPTVIKIEDCSTTVETPPNTSVAKTEVTSTRPAEASVATNTTPVFPTSSSVTPVTHIFYEHPTPVVQLAQAPQPSASVQTENGKRSQATSPVHPSDTCLSPPLETPVVPQQPEVEEVSIVSAVPTSTTEGPVQVQDASNQTETPPVSEDENCDSSNKEHISEVTQKETVPAVTVAAHVENSKHEIDSSKTQEAVDLSGLELLSNSIEQYEHIQTNSSTPDNFTETVADKPVETVPSCPSEESSAEAKLDVDSSPTIEKAAETLQLLCQQSSAQFKRLTLSCCPESKCDSDCVDCYGKSEENVKPNITGSSSNVPLQSPNMLGGLGLLCALAEQRFLEEVGTTEDSSFLSHPSSSSVNTTEKLAKTSNSSFESNTISNVDVKRNYRTRESERECKKFIANKVMQYYHNGGNSGSSSPQHSQQHSILGSICTSPSSAEIMDAMELEMRMRLAELQRKYREKQKELSKLTPKKSSSGSESGSTVTSPDISSSMPSHPVKRGPGRPRKKCKKLSLDSPPVSPPSIGPTRPRVGRPPLLKSKESTPSFSSRELPPPVLEKVTDFPKTRPRFDDDIAAPKLKASKFDILKPPTLTANKILNSAKFKPALNSNPAGNGKGIKLPQCNVNLVKLSANDPNSITKDSTDSNKSKHVLSAFSDNTSSVMEKLSAFSSGRLSTPNHTFGSKPPTRLPSPGETESLFWFKNMDKASSFSTLSQRLSPDTTASDSSTLSGKDKHSPSPPNLSPSHLPSSSPTFSSSQKRKVGRPKKHLSATGSEIATETIVAKKPKSKSNLVGLLLSKNKPPTQKPLIHSTTSATYKSLSGNLSTDAISFGTVSSYHKTLSSNLSGGFSSEQSTPNHLKSAILPNLFKSGCTNASTSKTSGGSLLKKSTSQEEDHKPNKIRPKLKAEAKVKTWSWGEDEDTVGIDWSGPSSESLSQLNTMSLGQGWNKKNEKPAKVASKSGTGNGPGRPRKEKPVDAKTDAACTTNKAVKKSASSPASTAKTSNSTSNKVSSNAATVPAPNNTSKGNATNIKTSTPATSRTPTPVTRTPTPVTRTPTPTSRRTPTPTGRTSTPTARRTPTPTKQMPNPTSKVSMTTSTATSSKDKKSVTVEKRVVSPDDQAPPAKKQKRNNSSQSSGGGSCESDDIPLSKLNKPNTSSCLLTQAQLNTENQRALIVMGGLFYAGTICAIRAPDVYGITLDGERGNRPHIYSREEILHDAILEVKPTNISSLTPGTRLCAYWSQQYRCLYPGTVAEPSSPDPELDACFVSVEFDDGDNGRINLDDIRLLPPDYPIVEYDPNPLLSLGKRRRRNSGTSCDSKDRKTSTDTPTTTTTSNAGGVCEVTKSENPVDKKPKAEISETKETEKKSETDNCEKKKQDAAEDKANKKKTASPARDDSATRERKRLKKRRREKLKRLMSCSTSALAHDGLLKKRHRKHRCGEEHCKHKRHHKHHRRHKHRHGRNKDSSSGSSGESGSKISSIDGDSLSRLSPVLEQLDVLEIQQTAVRQLAAAQQSAATSTPVTSTASTTTTTVTKATTGSKKKAEEKKSVKEQKQQATATPVPAAKAAEAKKVKKEKEAAKPKKGRDRQSSVESRSKMAAFLPARQLWRWSGRGFKRPGAKGRGKKEFFKAIERGKETIRVGDCAVFLSTGRPDRPYIGRIESMWEAWGTNMIVRVKWFYHPEETVGCTAQLKYPGALFESPHADENDVQTISHKCEVLPLDAYTDRLGSEPHRYTTIYDNNDIYYLAGYYDPTTSQLTMKPGVS